MQNADPETLANIQAANNKKKQKMFADDVKKGDVEKVKDKNYKGIDPNFLTENEGTKCVD